MCLLKHFSSYRMLHGLFASIFQMSEFDDPGGPRLLWGLWGAGKFFGGNLATNGIKAQI